MCLNDLFKESNRLKSFKTWKVPFISKHELAMYGMYFCGKGDLVRCHFCELELGKITYRYLQATIISFIFLECWEKTDRPFEEHLRHSPRCNLLNGRYTKNVPLCKRTSTRVRGDMGTPPYCRKLDDFKGEDIPDRLGDSGEMYRKFKMEQEKKNCINSTE